MITKHEFIFMKKLNMKITYIFTFNGVTLP